MFIVSKKSCGCLKGEDYASSCSASTVHHFLPVPQATRHSTQHSASPGVGMKHLLLKGSGGFVTLEFNLFCCIGFPYLKGVMKWKIKMYLICMHIRDYSAKKAYHNFHTLKLTPQFKVWVFFFNPSEMAGFEIPIHNITSFFSQLFSTSGQPIHCQGL